MVTPIEFATHTPLADGLRRLIKDFETRTGLREPIKMFIAGGMATHLYTAERVTTDVDAEFSKRVLLPPDLVVETSDGKMLYIDPNYNSSFALLHEDYLSDALPVPIGTDLVHVYVLSPIDLIISKIARFSGPDAGDIADLISRFRIPASEIEQRAEHALGGYIGNRDSIRANLHDVLSMAERFSADHKK
jgi:hypothetical protein